MGKVMCFTGHRPNQLGGYNGPNAQRFQNRLLRHLTKVVEQLAMKGFDTFITGGAVGTDQIAAWAVIIVKKNPQFSHIKLVIARPFERQHTAWPQHVQNEFFLLLEQADEVIDVDPDPSYAPWKMQARNVWMVDKSVLVVAVWAGTQKGGTWNCIQYAAKKQINILIINPKTLKEDFCPQGKL